MATVAVEMMLKLEFELLHHPACNPDLIPFVFHVFKPLRGVLHGCQFANDEEVKDMVHMASHATESILHRWHQEVHGLK
jgi:hypothetical protein